jgi:MtN3 and saliva related transmembrane protein
VALASEPNEVLGLVAATLTTSAFVPQVLKVWRSRSADDLSVATLLVFSVGILLWLLYGLRLGSVPLIGANAVTLALNLVILGLKRRYDRRG